MVKVSIIIPVYNVENYIRQCLDSVANQTLEQIEIICVNDGSTDSSPQILEEYALKDERIRIINKENNGTGAARKTGLDNAKGEFIAFVDSDDWVKLDAFEKLYKNIVSNNSDIVISNFYTYDELTNLYNEFHFNIADFFDEETDFNNFIFDYRDIKPLLLNGFTGCTNKLYRTEFLRTYDDFYFPKHITIGEDVPLNIQVLLRARRISFCRRNYYIYRTSNDNSTCHTSVKSEKIFDIFTIIDKVEDILMENKILDRYKNEFYRFQISHLMHWFDRCDKMFKEEFFQSMKQHFVKFDFDDDELSKLDLHLKNNFQNIINSGTNTEFELKEEIKLLESTYKNRLAHEKQAYYKKLELNKRAYEDKFNLQKSAYEEKLEVQEQIIKKISSSNSWKLTKPLRKIAR
jgi:glycosyltransferase involved in cell wall biosynthesis